MKQSHASHFSILHLTVPSRALSNLPNGFHCFSLLLISLCFSMQPLILHQRRTDFVAGVRLTCSPQKFQSAVSKTSSFWPWQDGQQGDLDHPFLISAIFFILHQFIYFSDVSLLLLLLVINNNNSSCITSLPHRIDHPLHSIHLPVQGQQRFHWLPHVHAQTPSSITTAPVLFCMSLYYAACFF